MFFLSVFTLNSILTLCYVIIEINRDNNGNLTKNTPSGFFEYDLEKKSQSSANILAFIDTQLDTVFLQLKESENKIQLFKDSSKVNDPAMFTQRILNNVADLNKELMY